MLLSTEAVSQSEVGSVSTSLVATVSYSSRRSSDHKRRRPVGIQQRSLDVLWRTLKAFGVHIVVEIIGATILGPYLRFRFDNLLLLLRHPRSTMFKPRTLHYGI